MGDAAPVGVGEAETSPIALNNSLPGIQGDLAPARGVIRSSDQPVGDCIGVNPHSTKIHKDGSSPVGVGVGLGSDESPMNSTEWMKVHAEETDSR